MVKYLDNYEKVQTRGSGLKSADLKKMNEFGLVDLHKVKSKTGTIPKTPNAFSITPLGRSIVRLALNKKISVDDLLLKNQTSIKELKEEVEDMQGSLNTIVNKLNNLLSDLSKINLSEPITSKPKPNLSGKEIVKQLKRSQQIATSNYRLGKLYSTEIYFNTLEKNYNINQDQINDILYKMFEMNKLELQMGPDNKGRCVETPSGKKFCWGKVID